MAIRKPINPQPGKVRIHVNPISLTIPQLTLDSLRAAPTPMIAVVFVCVVETGIPVREERSRKMGVKYINRTVIDEGRLGEVIKEIVEEGEEKAV